MIPPLSRSRVCLALCIFSLLAAAALLISVRPGASQRLSASASANPRATAAQRKAMDAFLHAPLPFEANLGQTDAAAKFIARGMRYTVFFTRQSVLLRLADPQVKDRDNILEMKLVGAREAEVRGLEPLASRSHYFHGNSPRAWQSDVPHYRKVSYTGAYRDTDLVFYGRQGELEYDVVLGPGADPRDVVLQFAGAQHLRVNAEGDLVLALSDGREILQRRPKIYQQSGGQKAEVSGGYRILAENRVRFEVGGYDRGKPLVIDPVLTYSSYLGGSSSGYDAASSIALDAAGNTYIAGYTASVGFPTSAIPPIQANRAGGNDAFIASLSADASTLRYSTYLGGTSDDFANGIAVDTSGNTYVTGYTYSSDFPATPGAYAHVQPGGSPSVFVAKLGPTGSNLVYATYLGSGTGAGIVADVTGAAYVVGTAYCCSFPTTAGAYLRVGSGADAFITKLNASGTALVWSTLLGGNSADSGTALALDSSQNVYITGYTFSSNFPVTAGAYQAVLAGNYDAFVAEVNSSGSSLLYSTLLGGSNYEVGNSIAVDSLGFAYVTGYTQSADFPTTAGVYQPSLGGYQDAFVAKVNQTGTGLVYSTHLGSYTNASGIAVDASGNAYIALSYSTIPVTNGAYNGGCCGGITKLNASGTALVYSSQLSASFSGIALDVSGNAYVAGSTYSSGYITTPGAFQPSLAGGSDAVMAKLSASGSTLLSSTFLGGNGGDQGFGIALDSGGNAYVTGSAGSLDFPVNTEAAKSLTGPYTQAFVTKFAPDGATLSYSTFVGGSGNDTGRAIAVDATGAVYVAGQTNSSDFPITVGAWQTTIGGGYDAFLFKLSPVGSLVYSTFIGGLSTEDARGVALDAAGNAYVAGNTSSSNFLATSILGSPAPFSSVFVTKVNPAGSAFVYSTLLGGSSQQTVSGIAVDSAGSAYLTGNTYSSNFPVTNGAYQVALQGNQSAFVAKLTPSGNALSYATYLGGLSNASISNAIAVDSAGSAYVTGYTSSASFPVSSGAFQPNLAGSQNAFVAKLNPAGSALSYSTYLGGSVNDSGSTIAVDAAGDAYVAGFTSSGNFPITNGATIMEVAIPNYYSYSTAFVASLNPSGSALLYSTFMGGSSVNGIAAKPGYVAVVGTTSTPNLLGSSLGFQKTIPSGATNAFVAKISDPPAGCSYNVSPTTFNVASSGGPVTVNVTAGPGCPWIAAPESSGALPLNPPSGVVGSGNGSVSSTVQPNTYTFAGGRVRLFAVAGQIITVVQAGPCAINLASNGATHGSGAVVSASIGVTSGSCSWSAFTVAPWITVSTASGNGNGTIGYKLLPNPQSASRTGIIYIGPQAFTVTQLGTGSNQATISTPPPGSAFPDSTVTFTWTAIAGADQYTLAVGSAAGQSNLCSAVTSNTTAVCSNLPTDASPVYVTLTTHLAVGGSQPPVSYTYTAATASLAQLLTPAPVVLYPGPPTTVLAGSQVTFSWSRGVGADNYWLDVGTSYGSGNLCGGPTTNTFSTCSSIPVTGVPIYVQLWTHYPATGWQTPIHYDYLAATVTLATLTSPTPGTTLPGAMVTFKWNPGTGADHYWMDVGTGIGQGNICASGPIVVTQFTCSGIPTDGSTVYVQLWTHASGIWQGPPNPAYRYTFTAAQLTTRAQLTSPVNGSAIPGASTTFTWNAIPGADQYWLDVGTIPGQGNICATSTSGTQFTCNNIPVTYQMSTPPPGTQLSSSSTFCWVGLTTYAQLWTHFPGTGWQTPVRYALGPPVADFWLDVGTALGQGNISAGLAGSSCKSVTIPSGLGFIYVQVWTRIPAGTGTWYGPVRYTYTSP